MGLQRMTSLNIPLPSSPPIAKRTLKFNLHICIDAHTVSPPAPHTAPRHLIFDRINTPKSPADRGSPPEQNPNSKKPRTTPASPSLSPPISFWFEPQPPPKKILIYIYIYVYKIAPYSASGFRPYSAPKYMPPTPAARSYRQLARSTPRPLS